MKSVQLCLWLLLICFGMFALRAQKATVLPPLERLVSINVSNMPLEDFLKELSEEGKFSFSYNPSILSSKRVTLNCKNKSVRYILNLVFGGTMSYKSKGNHVILSMATVQKPLAQKTAKYFKVTGYVVDGNTSARLSEVSIYDDKTLHSTLSDDFGYFTIQLPSHSADIVLRIEKAGYKDSSIVITQKEFQSVELAINPHKSVELVVNVPDDSSALVDTTRTVANVMFQERDTTVALPKDEPESLWLIINSKIRAHMVNISDTLFRRTQISLIPGASTNRLISGNVVNEYSMNLLVGYSQGVRKFEIGGLANINRGDVGKVQLSGLFNIVGGKLSGFQVAGLMNFVNDTVQGTQLAGLMNFSDKHTHGSQVAGLANHASSVEGAQTAGLYNLATDLRGAQIAGLFNIADSVRGSQTAGLFNITQKSKGSQTAGLFNIADTLRGSQTAGLFNVGKVIKGSQTSALLNIAKKVVGIQLGFLNVADSTGGVPIGFLSLIKTGYHKVELSTDEVLRYNIAFRLGVHKLHNIFGIGTTFEGGDKFAWSYGYGLGSTFKLGKKLYFDVDVFCSQVNGSTHAEYLSLNNKVNIGLDWQFAKKFSLAFGPSFNAYVVDDRLFAQDDFYRKIGNGYPAATYPQSDEHINVRSWVGWKVALRFL